MITNEQGQIAVVYGQSIPKVIDVNGKGYAFVVKSCISLAWIDIPDVAKILAITGRGCCGNKHAQIFAYASTSQVQVWKTGHY